ncbi:hypothetical protein VTN77DRAFT_4511 [Rasamsonia byssochlamydoides]|uniref:uncharacterized protein n=1 Tax=Rasamsonia byssochlamydoides TaxID=89139 RepID=UPI0037447BEE
MGRRDGPCRESDARSSGKKKRKNDRRKDHKVHAHTRLQLNLRLRPFLHAIQNPRCWFLLVSGGSPEPLRANLTGFSGSVPPVTAWTTPRPLQNPPGNATSFHLPICHAGPFCPAVLPSCIFFGPSSSQDCSHPQLLLSLINAAAPSCLLLFTTFLTRHPDALTPTAY